MKRTFFEIIYLIKLFRFNYKTYNEVYHFAMQKDYVRALIIHHLQPLKFWKKKPDPNDLPF